MPNCWSRSGAIKVPTQKERWTIGITGIAGSTNSEELLVFRHTQIGSMGRLYLIIYHLKSTNHVGEIIEIYHQKWTLWDNKNGRILYAHSSYLTNKNPFQTDLSSSFGSLGFQEQFISEPQKQTNRILSSLYWLFNRDPFDT